MTDLMIVAGIGFAGQIIAAAIAAIWSQHHATRVLHKTTNKTELLLLNLKWIAEGTHTIVNSQRTVLLRLVAELAKRIARENPKDLKARDQAEAARVDEEKAEAR